MGTPFVALSMDSSPSKRRKLSPAASVVVDASNTALAAFGHDEKQQRKSARASYQSPTKASLARFNPSLQATPTPAGGGGLALQEGSDRRHRSASPRRLNPVALRANSQSRLGKRYSASPVRNLQSSPTRKTQSLGGAAAFVAVPPAAVAAASRRSMTPAVASQQRQYHQAQQQQLSTEKDAPRPREASLSRASPVVTTSAQKQHAGTKQKTLGVARSAVKPLGTRSTTASDEQQTPPVSTDPTASEAEPKLPSLPKKTGPKARRSVPGGLQSSSPHNRKAGLRKSFGKFSPQKALKAARGPEPEPELEREREQDGADELSQTQKEPRGPDPARSAPKRSQQLRLPNSVEAPSEEKAAIARKRQTIAQLSKRHGSVRSETTELQDALQECQDAGKTVSSLGNHQSLMSIITSSLPKSTASAAAKAPSFSQKLSLFFPSSKIDASPSLEPKDAPLPRSHAPIEVADQMPYLRAFTPMKISTACRLLLPANSNEALKQEQILVLSSPSALLSVILKLVTHVDDESVISLSLERVSPWAQHELGQGIQSLLFSGDVSSVGWACGKYWELSSTRARCWARCKRRFPHLVADAVGGAGLPLHSKRAAAGRSGDLASSSGEGGRDVKGDLEASAFSQRDWQEDVGRQSLLFAREGACFMVKWKISVDWVGEVESDICVSTSFPFSWYKADERGSLNKIGEAFDRILQELGPFEAICVLLGLVFPEED